ncbi:MULTISPECIES: hypothetical protein [Streptacidiphilus]|uniref:Uncharacterized protein n=1 Tax=Streptacidiphilus cavernicola TaxID=3342716 RepID=A0ABV6UL88_9ACTN|nr:hypothetical protein [Streptacidiphilus jeojiense]
MARRVTGGELILGWCWYVWGERERETAEPVEGAREQVMRLTGVPVMERGEIGGHPRVGGALTHALLPVAEGVLGGGRS